MENNQNAQINQPANGSNALAIASMILGIVSIIFAFLFSWVGLIAGIVGIILAVMSRKNPAKKGMGTAGLVCSIIGVALSGIIITCTLCIAGTIGSIGSAISELA